MLQKVSSEGSGLYVYLGKWQTLNQVTNHEKLRKFSVMLTNKTKPRSVNVNEIYLQHQIDLADMNNMKVEHKWKFYCFDIFLCWICFLVSIGLFLLKEEKVAMYKKELQRTFKG